MKTKILLRFFLAAFSLIGFAFTSLAQLNISGTVLDENDTPMPGVSVLVLGANQGTSTDIDGKYTLQVSPLQSDTGFLRFSFIGYKTQKVLIQGKSVIDVKLIPNAELIQEAVVAAIGIKKEKRKLGYAVTEVDGEELNRSGEGNVMNALNAKVAGVQVTSSSGSPGASTTVRIRGNTSISGNNAPLYVVDGVPISDDYQGSNFTDQANRAIDINPDDIESIAVLKGGAATALYGIRAGNGAVIITTKSGQGKGSRVTLKTGFTVDQVNKLPSKQTRFGQGEGGEFIPGTRFSWGPEIQGEVFIPEDDFFINGTTFTQYASIEGGTKDKNILLSVGNMSQSGIIPNSTYRRTNFKVNGSTTWKKSLSAKGGINLIFSKAQRPQRGSNLSGVMLGLMRAPVDYDLANGFDNPADEPLAYSLPDGSQRTYHDVYDNPYWSVNKNQNNESVNRAIAYLELKYSLNESWSVLNRLSVDYYQNSLVSYWDSGSAEYRDLGGRINVLNGFQRDLNNDLILMFNHNYGEDWDVDLTFGHNVFDYYTEELSTDGVGFIIPNYYDLSNIDAINIISDDYLERQRGVGVYTDATVGWKRMLYVGFTGRNDWLSNLPANNNSFFYPAVNLSWIFTELPGKTWPKWFDYGKIRTSFADVGNGAPSPYLTSNFFQAGAPVQGQITFEPNQVIGNPDLRPERTQSFEIGTDLRFFQNRLTFDLAYYRNETTDPIVVSFIPASSGYSTAVLNGTGPIINQGWEALLSYQISQEGPRAITWNTSLQFTRARNLVEGIVEGLDEVPLASFGLASTQSAVVSGQPYGVLLGTAWERDEMGNILVNDEGYPIVSGERQVVGDPNPHFTAGLRNTFSLKNWTLSFLFDIRVGGDMYNGTANVMRFHGTHVDTESREEFVVWEGVNINTGEANTVEINLDQSFYSRYGLVGVSEAGVEEVNWLRLRDLSLSYTLPKSLAQKLKVSAASIAFTSRNLWLLTNYTGIDPETSLSGAGNGMGRDYFNSPNTKSFGVQLQLTL